MGPLRSLWTGATGDRPKTLAASASVVVLGVMLIAIGETLDWGWTRLIGAGLISVGSIAFGVVVGWSDPVRPHIAGLLTRARRAIVLALTLIMVAPLLVTLLVGFGGLVAGDNTGDWYVLLVGIVITVLLLGVTAATAGVAFTLALRGLDRTEPDGAANGNGRGER